MINFKYLRDRSRFLKISYMMSMIMSFSIEKLLKIFKKLIEFIRITNLTINIFYCVRLMIIVVVYFLLRCFYINILYYLYYFKLIIFFD